MHISMLCANVHLFKNVFLQDWMSSSRETEAAKHAHFITCYLHFLLVRIFIHPKRRNANLHTELHLFFFFFKSQCPSQIWCDAFDILPWQNGSSSVVETKRRHVETVTHQTHLRDYQNYFSLRLSIFLTQSLMQQTAQSLLFDTSGEVWDFNILTVTFVIQMKVNFRFVFLSTCHKCYVDAVSTIWC